MLPILHLLAFLSSPSHTTTELKMSPLVRYSPWLSRFKNLQFPKTLLVVLFSSNTAAENEKPTLPGPPPICVGISESAGRGVFATRRICAGDLVHTAKPIVSHPSLSVNNKVCYFCLKKLTLTELENQSVAFCSEACKENAKVFYDVETKANWTAFNDYCRNQGLKYPLIVKRLACMVISGSASAESLDILQPANLFQEMILEMEEGFDLLRSCFAKANFTHEWMAFLTKQWYYNVLARIRINAFRIDLAVGLYEDILSSAAACVEAEAAVGNAVYMLPSFYNHDCDPNTHITWIDNANAKLYALRDIEKDEELRICYIDASMDRDARQNILLQGFGFRCNCPRCLSGD